MTALTKDILVELLDKQKHEILEILAETEVRIEQRTKAMFMFMAMDTEKPQEMQEVMAWVRSAKMREETIKARFLGKITDFIAGAIIALLVTGFLYSYMCYQNPVLVREEKVKINKIMKVKEKVGGF